MTARTCIALAAASLFAGAVQAAPLTADEMLKQFNVVVTGNLTSTSHVDGRTWVGGNLAGGDYVQHVRDTPASAYAGLTVGGAITKNNGTETHVNGLGAVVGGSVTGLTVNSGQTYVGGSASSSSFNGDAWVNGSASNVNFNGYGHAASYSNTNNNRPLSAVTSTMTSTLAVASSTDFSSVMANMSNKLSALKGTTGTAVNFSNNDHQVTFTGTGGADGVLVFDLTALDSKIFSSTTTDISFNLTNATTVIFNTDDKTLNLTANFNQAASLGSSLIWNFAGADTSVTVGRTFGGQVLVADGTFSNVGGANVEGGVFAKTLNQQGEIHLQAFTGSLATAVPEPETYAMLLAGLGLMGVVARRRKQA